MRNKERREREKWRETYVGARNRARVGYVRCRQVWQQAHD